MRFQRLLGMVALIAALSWLSGCGKQSPPVVIQNNPPPVIENPANPGSGTTAPAKLADLSSDLTPEDKTDGVLRAALGLAAERKFADALEVLKAAQAIQDSETIRQQIERIKGQLVQKEAAEKTVQEIQSVLKDGNADEATRLAGAGLQQFGGGDEAERLTQLKQQADALRAAALDDKQARRERFAREGDAALKENNLRAAAIALDLAVEAGGDGELRRQLDDIRTRLTRYDELRHRAAELRRDPANLDDAVAALQEAAKAWDTLQVRQDLDDYNLALNKRRERLSIAEFEVRGDVGIPLAGRAIAEELLPAFKTRFDVVEREQLARVLDELKLQPTELADSGDGRRDVNRLAKVRYMVLGSISSLSGVTVNARLIDLRSGLIVQTGKIVGRTPEEAFKQLPQLAEMLTMTDEQRIAQENRLAQQALQEVRPVEAAAPLPPPPPAFAQDAPPPPPIIFNPRPPQVGTIVVADFERLPILAFGAPPPPPPLVVVVQPPPVRQRLLQVSLEIGDNLFRRGQFREAHRHFELALNLAPGEVDIRLRLERTRPWLPPPPPPIPVPVVVVPVPRPVFVPPPRIAVLNFIVNSDPRFTPPGFADWVSAYFATQFAPRYEVVDRGELFWYMGRLGLTVRDVLVDPFARQSLAQALNVRFFVFGVVQQTASFDVSTHMVDAENGTRQGVGAIHVQDRDEMKLRMADLVHQMHRDPAQRDQIVKEARDNEKQINDVRQLLRQGKPVEAAALGREALKQRPGDVALQALVAQADRAAQDKALAEVRRKEAEQRQAQILAAQKRQQELAQQAEMARLQSEKAAREQSDAARQAKEQQRTKAHDELVAQANAAAQRKDFSQAAKLLQSAVALKPSDAGFDELAKVKGQQAVAAKARADEEKQHREQERLKRQEDDLARGRTKLEEQRKTREAEELKRQKVQEARDTAAAVKLVGNAQDLLKQKKFDSAIQMLQTAQRLKPSDEVQKLLHDARDQKAEADAEKKGAAAKAALDKRIAEENAVRAKAEADAKAKQDKYNQAFQQAQKAQAEKNFAAAIRHFQEASQIFRTDEAINGLRQAQQDQAKAAVQAEAEKKKLAEETQKTAKVKQLLADGQAALQAKQFDKAVKLLTEAKQLNPTNVEVLAALSKAEHARDDASAQAKRPKVDPVPASAFQKQLDDGRAKLAKKDLEGAAQAANEALKLKPGDPEAQALLKEIDKARSATADTDAKKKADFQALLGKARQALARDQFDDALGLLSQADKLFPGDKEAAALRKDIEKERAEAKTGASKKKAEFQARLTKARQAVAAKRFDDALTELAEADKLMPGDKDAATLRKEAEKGKKDIQDADLKKRLAEYRQVMTNGDKAMSAKRFDEAVKQYQEALKIIPNDPGAMRALADAKKALEAPKVPPKATAQDEYAKHMQAGEAFEKQQKFDDAIKAYRDALKALPGDTKATAALRNAEYLDNVADGNKALKAKRFGEAVKAFEAALKLKPGDPEATEGLKKAKAGKP